MLSDKYKDIVYLSTITTYETGIEDEYGVTYSMDGKRLLRCKNKKLKCYTIKKGTKVICNDAFYNSFQSGFELEKITIPNTVTAIGNRAFKDCESLQQVDIPNSVTTIGSDAFTECMSMLNITIPDSVTYIGEGAFSFCESLQEIHIHNNTTFSISNNMLINNKNKEILAYFGNEIKVLIPNSVTTIGDRAFSGRPTIQKLTIPDSVIDIGEGAFEKCESLQQITIPNSVTEIKCGVFTDCKALQKITIPESIKKIGFAFYNCNNLSTLNFNASNCEDMASEPDDPFWCYQSVFEPCWNLSLLNIGKSVSAIPVGAFACCEKLKIVIIPDSVTSIGVSAFWSCKSLQQIIIPDSVTSIADEALSQCESLQQIIIPEGTTEKFKKMLPKELWDKLYYLKKAE